MKTTQSYYLNHSSPRLFRALPSVSLLLIVYLSRYTFTVLAFSITFIVPVEANLTKGKKV